MSIVDHRLESVERAIGRNCGVCVRMASIGYPAYQIKNWILISSSSVRYAAVICISRCRSIRTWNCERSLTRRAKRVTKRALMYSMFHERWWVWIMPGRLNRLFNIPLFCARTWYRKTKRYTALYSAFFNSNLKYVTYTYIDWINFVWVTLVRLIESCWVVRYKIVLWMLLVVSVKNRQIFVRFPIVVFSLV